MLHSIHDVLHNFRGLHICKHDCMRHAHVNNCMPLLDYWHTSCSKLSSLLAHDIWLEVYQSGNFVHLNELRPSYYLAKILTCGALQRQQRRLKGRHALSNSTIALLVNRAGAPVLTSPFCFVSSSVLSESHLSSLHTTCCAKRWWRAQKCQQAQGEMLYLLLPATCKHACAGRCMRSPRQLLCSGIHCQRNELLKSLCLPW
jgi:hypothetical protein